MAGEAGVAAEGEQRQSVGATELEGSLIASMAARERGKRWTTA